MKNCIFEKHKFQMKLISFWFVRKKNINIYEKISLELSVWKSLVSFSDVKTNTRMEHVCTCVNCIYIHFSTCFYEKNIIHYSCLFAVLAKIKIWKVHANFGKDSLKEL